MEHGEFELGTDGPSAILIGVDDSVTASRAAWYAAGLARRQGARVVAVYVAPVAGMALASSTAPAVVAAENEAYDEIAKEMAERAETVARELGISITFILAHGDRITRSPASRRKCKRTRSWSARLSRQATG